MEGGEDSEEYQIPSEVKRTSVGGKGQQWQQWTIGYMKRNK